MDGKDIERICASYAQQFPPLITFKQAAEIAHVPLGTVYDYSSRRLFDGFRTKVGRHVLLDLAAFVTFILTHNKPQN